MLSHAVHVSRGVPVQAVYTSIHACTQIYMHVHVIITTESNKHQLTSSMGDRLPTRGIGGLFCTAGTLLVSLSLLLMAALRVLLMSRLVMIGPHSCRDPPGWGRGCSDTSRSERHCVQEPIDILVCGTDHLTRNMLEACTWRF